MRNFVHRFPFIGIYHAAERLSRVASRLITAQQRACRGILRATPHTRRLGVLEELRHRSGVFDPVPLRIDVRGGLLIQVDRG
jgi:hypothetical protein